MKQNVVQSTNVEHFISASHSGSCFTQWINDNVDHNLATIDGKQTFDGMGIICATTGQFGHKKDTVIPREKYVKATQAIKNKGIEIVPYISSLQPGVYESILRPIDQLDVSYLPPVSLMYELVWNAGYYCRKRDFLRPSWSGFMQDAYQGQYPSKSDIYLLPIVDLNSSDPTCIYSTLLYVESQAKKLKIITPCITFDQPLWIKAMDIIKSKSMNIVCILGGVLCSIRKMMKESGLEESLETVYGENVVQNMMSGKSVISTRALRGHFLVEATLMNSLIFNFIPQEFTEDDVVKLRESELTNTENQIESEENHLEEEQDNSHFDCSKDKVPVSKEKCLSTEEITNLFKLYELCFTEA